MPKYRKIKLSDEINLYNAGTDRRNGCDLCESCFDSETEVELHKQLSHRSYLESQYLKKKGCHVCQRFYPNMQTLKAHFEKHHLFINKKNSQICRPVYLCDDCHMLFFNKRMLAVHIAHRHRRDLLNKTIKCGLCAKHCRVKYVYQHMDKKHTRSLKSCPVCLERQDSIAFLSTHVHMEHPTRHCCHLCSFKGETESDLSQHLLTAHDRRSVAASTPHFDRYFSRLQPARKARVRRIVYPSRGIPLDQLCALCLLCQKVVYNASEMAEHISSNHGHTFVEREVKATPPATEPRAAVYRSCECGALFTTEVLLKHHRFKMHSPQVKQNVDDDFDKRGDLIRTYKGSDNNDNKLIKDTVNLDAETFEIVIELEDGDENGDQTVDFADSIENDWDDE